MCYLSTSVDDIIRLGFWKVMPSLTLDVKTWCLNRPHYFFLVHNLKSHLNLISSLAQLFHSWWSSRELVLPALVWRILFSQCDIQLKKIGRYFLPSKHDSVISGIDKTKPWFFGGFPMRRFLFPICRLVSLFSAFVGFFFKTFKDFATLYHEQLLMSLEQCLSSNSVSWWYCAK